MTKLFLRAGWPIIALELFRLGDVLAGNNRPSRLVLCSENNDRPYCPRGRDLADDIGRATPNADRVSSIRGHGFCIWSRVSEDILGRHIVSSQLFYPCRS